MSKLKRFSFGLIPLSVAALLSISSNVQGEEPKSTSPATLNQLILEVSALQILHNLNATPAQLQQLRKLAKETQSKDADLKPGKSSDKFRATLLEMHQALLESKNPDQIDKLSEKLDSLREEEKPELEDDVDLTESARQRAPEALRLLGAPQVAAYLSGLVGDIGDPRARLVEALNQVRTMSHDQWTAFRGNFGDEIGRLIAGVDSEKSDKISDQVVQLLLVARSLKEAEFKTQRPDLEKTALKIVGDIGPFQVLQNVMENVMATLLSNPRVSAAIDARLQKK
jgi:ribosomal protein L10